jgi:hypothetical protein
MRCLTVLFAVLIASPALANSFERPIPQALIMSMIAVQRLVSRR